MRSWLDETGSAAQGLSAWNSIEKQYCRTLNRARAWRQLSRLDRGQFSKSDGHFFYLFLPAHHARLPLSATLMRGFILTNISPVLRVLRFSTAGCWRWLFHADTRCDLAQDKRSSLAALLGKRCLLNYPVQEYSRRSVCVGEGKDHATGVCPG
jgi:hypothetical protein